MVDSLRDKKRTYLIAQLGLSAEAARVLTIADLELQFYNSGGGGAHPDLAAHNTLGLATQTELDAVAAIEAAQVHRKFKSGLYYSISNAGSDAVLALVLNEMRLSPFIVGENQTFDRIGQEVTTLGSTSVVRLGIYGVTSENYPGALLLDAGTIDAGSTGGKEIVINQALTPGLYYLAAVAQVATCSVRSKNSVPDLLGAPTLVYTNSTVYVETGVSGALPANFTGVVANATSAPKVELRAA